jgi:hypothetical protein
VGCRKQMTQWQGCSNRLWADVRRRIEVQLERVLRRGRDRRWRWKESSGAEGSTCDVKSAANHPHPHRLSAESSSRPLSAADEKSGRNVSRAAEPCTARTEILRDPSSSPSIVKQMIAAGA